MKNTLAIYLLTPFMFSACVVSKPDCTYVSQPDYNKKVSVENAHFDKVLSAAGYTAFAATTLAGGYYGYQSEMIHYYQEGKRETFAPGGAVIGAAAGFTLTYLVNRALGWGKTDPAYDPKKWIKKSNNQFILISNNSNNYKLIHQSAEPYYVIKNLKDADEFKKAFPNSYYVDNAFKSGVENCTRNEMPELINYFPKSKYVTDAKIKYVNLSPSYDDLKTASRITYPGLGLDLEKKYADLIRKIPDALDFKTHYPKTNLNKQAVAYSFHEENQTKEKIIELKTKYSGDFELEPSDIKLFGDDNINKNYLNARLKITSIKTLYDLDEFYSNYQWLSYSAKSNDILNNYWLVGYKSFNKGNMVIAAIELLAIDKQYKSWGISKDMANNFIALKLEEEIKTKVNFTHNTVASSNSQWKDWIDNDTYTAGLVAETGDIKHLVYGEVTNNSKFDLPVTITATGELYSQASAKVLGYDVMGTINSIASFFGVQGEIKVQPKYLNTSTENFHIPLLQAGQKGNYAILMDFGSSDRYGINVFDLAKVINDINVKNVNVSTSLLKFKPDYYILEKQNDWQKFASNGLPEGTLTDLYRNKEVNDDEWREKYREILEERRRAAALAYQRSEASFSSGAKYRLDEANIKTKELCNYTCQIHRYKFHSVKYGESSITLYYWPGSTEAKCSAFDMAGYKAGYYEPELGTDRFWGKTLDEAFKEILEYY